ncbi:MAG: MOSC domain-containing protein [Rhodocyclales bacterium]|nr:MOSC domain-containing protein [Rhodocyclales bacterium]
MVRLFRGGIRPLPLANEPTGIFKSELAEPVWLGSEGLAGDAQADRRVHGGPEKALHQYPAPHYARLATAFPQAAARLVPGSLGENLSVGAWDESAVCIGDVFRLGDARIEVSQPRSPCWKIDCRFAVAGMTGLIAAAGITGWYYRVIEAGAVAPGDVFELLDRPAPAASIAHCWTQWQAPQPDAAVLTVLAALPALSPNWRQKLAARAAAARSP